MTGMTNQRENPYNTYDPTRAIARWETEGGAVQVTRSSICSNLNLTASSDHSGKRGKQKTSTMKRIHRGD